MRGMSASTLAVALHDPDGRTVAGIERTSAVLREHFSSVAVNATTVTPASVLDAFATRLDAKVITHAADERFIGAARRNAVELGLALDEGQILYSDGDHILRWVEARPDEVAAALTGPTADLVVIGRSKAAMDASPRRLRETERVINHIYSLMRPGRDWDLMFAVRRLTREAAQLIVSSGREPTVANDVEWPLLVERHGLSVDYYAADGLSYRTIHEFDRSADNCDGDPTEWIRRVEIAADHAAGMRPFL